jgi:hypothetical protein
MFRSGRSVGLGFDRGVCLVILHCTSTSVARCRLSAGQKAPGNSSARSDGIRKIHFTGR